MSTPTTPMQLTIFSTFLSLMTLLLTTCGQATPNPSRPSISIGSSDSSSIDSREAKRDPGVVKEIFLCTGKANSWPSYDCPSDTCHSWRNEIDAHQFHIPATGTNCIDTNCNTSFKVCNKKGKCINWDSDKITPDKDAQEHCIYSVPGTDSVYLWV